jgi:methylthioribulose-1-phosphate dehydratase
MFVMEHSTGNYIRKPLALKPSQCTPLFREAFKRGAQACIHTHSQWAVLVTLLVEKLPKPAGTEYPVFRINNQEMIKGIPAGRTKSGYLGYYDTLEIPIIENTAR